jgi:hypothetical protein
MPPRLPSPSDRGRASFGSLQAKYVFVCGLLITKGIHVLLEYVDTLLLLLPLRQYRAHFLLGFSVSQKTLFRKAHNFLKSSDNVYCL